VSLEVEADKHLIEYLRGKYGNTLTPKQLSQEIPVSAKQQSLLRQANKFPIKHKNIGKNVYYSIYSVASFLLDDEVKEEPIITTSKQSTPKKQSKLADSNIADLSCIFNMKGFVAKLEQQQSNINNLIIYFKSKIAYEELQRDLPLSKPQRKHIKV